jgi:uncharacterized zinc-type alcohol dehydrogenase-like protein
MILVQGYAAPIAKAPLEPFSFQRRELGDYDVLVRIHYCGICHSDIHQVRDEWGGALFPMVPGHEIVGVVEAIGTEVKQFKVGDAVGVGCLVDACRQCDSCENGLEQYCFEEPTWTYNSIERDGSSLAQGGYSTKIVVNERFVLHLPNNLAMEACAPLLCAGITLYSPLKHWKAGPGKNIAIVGLGGLGHVGVKIAHAMGAEVTVLSHSSKKQQDSKRLGADHFYDTSQPDTFKNLSNYFDLILCTVSEGINWNDYLKLLKRDGALVLLGIPASNVPPVEASSLINARRHLAGSLIGGIQETQEMLDFCGQHDITADIELIPMQKVNEAYDRVLRSDVRYRFVIDMSSLDENP